jgi:hypothetical protein
MDGVHEFLDTVRRRHLARGNFLGLLNLLIGRRIDNGAGGLICNGLTWRSVAGWLKKLRWDKQAVRELGLEPKNLPPRDRERFWYAAISLARVDSAEASRAGDRLAATLEGSGYRIGPAPHPTPPKPST